MESFSAVVTTGIYCRPGCSARPSPENVRAYPLAAASEAAGFRACLRCRPYRVAQPLGQVGPELVCRAVQLIVDGALDDTTEPELASRLGVSARHLRRLFVTNVGVTPDQLARSRRAHFARRLLDDSDLAITDIAFAAGFGSVRQMNRALQEVFRASPSELRRRRRAADRLVADGGLSVRLPYEGALDWPTMASYLSGRAVRGVEHVTDDGMTYRRTVLVDGDPGVIEVTPAGDDDDRSLMLVAHLPHWEGLIHLVQRVRRIFSLDVDMGAANDALAHDPAIGPLVEKRPGLRVPGTWDPFEIGVRAIVGQQISVAGATTIMGRLVERLGAPVPGLAQLRLDRLFPTPDAVATGDLAALGLTTSREKALASFAAAVAEGRVLLDRSVSTDEFVSSLVALAGIGEWTAQYVAMRMGEPDAFPASDLGLRRGFDRTDPPSAGQLATHAEAWRPWRSVAAVHLWHA